MAKKKDKVAKAETEVENAVEVDATEQAAEPNKWEKIAQEQEVVEEKEQAAVKSTLSDRSRESLENEILDMRTQQADAKNMVLRSQAEMQNLRRRLDRDMANARKYANEKVIGDLLPVLDSLTRGIETLASDDAAKEGLTLTHTMLKEALEKHGVVVIHPEAGEAFNPDRHEAMSMIPQEGAESNTVLEVLQPGCELNGRVLRAAMVVVAK